MKRAKDKERVAALSMGLAIVVLVWVAAQAFASDRIAALGTLSIWFYGPISAAAWGLLSLISYTLIVRAQRRNPALCPEHEEATREARLAACPGCRWQADPKASRILAGSRTSPAA